MVGWVVMSDSVRERVLKKGAAYTNGPIAGVVLLSLWRNSGQSESLGQARSVLRELEGNGRSAWLGLPGLHSMDNGESGKNLSRGMT